MAQIQNPSNIIMFSQMSLLEIAIKLKIGKLPNFTASVEDVYLQAINDGFTFIDLQNQHIFNYQEVYLFDGHRDPFDRVLISTAIQEDAVLLSPDAKFRLYGNVLKVLW